MNGAGGRFSLEFPLLKRELLGLLRTRRAFWLLVLTVAFSSLLPLLSWPSADDVARSSEANIGVLLTFFLTQLAAAVLVIPAFTADAISGERERDTYQLLHSTLLPPASIVLSKTLASSGYVVLLLLASAPAAFVLYFLGGIDFETIGICYAVTLAAVLSSGMICLSQSMRSRRTAHAAVLGMAWVLFWNGGLSLLILLLAAVHQRVTNGYGVTGEAACFAACLSPFPQVPMVIIDQMHGIPYPGIYSRVPPWVLYLAFSGFLSLGNLFYLLRKARAAEQPRSRWRRHLLAIQRIEREGRPARRCIFARALIALGEGGFPLLRNPVFLKEVRAEFFGRNWYRRLVFWGSVLISIGLAVASGGGGDGVHAITFLAVALIMFLVPGVVATGFPREIEQGNIDFLRGSRLSLGEVMTGKFLGGLYSCFGILAAAFWVELGLLLSLPPTASWTVAVSVAVISMTLLFASALSTFASAVSRRALASLLVAYISTLVLFVVWPMVLSRSVIIVFGGEPPPTHIRALAATHPLLAFFAGTEPAWEGTLSLFHIFHAAASAILLFLAWRFLERFRARDR